MSYKHDRTPTEQAYLDYAQRKISYQEYRLRLEEIRKQIQEHYETQRSKGDQYGRLD